MDNRIGSTFLSGALVVGMGLSAAFAVPRPGGGFRGGAAPHPGIAPHGAPVSVAHGIPHGGPAFHPAGGLPGGRAEFARNVGGPGFHDPAMFHSPGAHWNGYHQVMFGGRPMRLGGAGYRPSFYYHPWYHGPWGGHQWGWGWGYAPGVSFGIGGGGVGVGVGWGYGGGYVGPYGAYGYVGRPLGWGFGGWGLGTIAYSSGYYPYSNPYYGPYAGQPGAYNYMNPIPVAAQMDPAMQGAGDDPAPQPDNPAFDEARAEFQRGHYSTALTNVDAAVRAVPTDAVAHEFRALVLFSLREYRQAAAVAHSVLAVGPGWDWTTMSSLYADPAIYSQQLQDLEEYSREHPKAADAHFLLGYHYMIGSHSEEAAREFHLAARLAPSDRLAGELLMMVKGPPKTAPASDTATGDGPPPAADAPELPPVDKDLLPGTWHASRDDGSRFRLTLTGDGKFSWKYSVPKQKAEEFGGTYSVDGPVLALERSEGGVLAGTVTFGDDGRFNFRMVGGPPQDTGLDFSK